MQVVLDAAAFAPTHKLDLTAVPADFVPLSFYKLFGYPTGIGALIVRKENLGLLRKVWASGASCRGWEMAYTMAVAYGTCQKCMLTRKNVLGSHRT